MYPIYYDRTILPDIGIEPRLRYLVLPTNPKTKSPTLTLPPWRILQDVGHQGTQVRSSFYPLQQVGRCDSSADNFCQAVDNPISRSPSASPSLDFAHHTDTLQPLKLHCMPENAQLSLC